MQYMILINSEPFDGPEPGVDGFDEMMAPWMAYNHKLIDGGHYVGADQLLGVETANTILRAYGAGDTIVDGSFAETKEHLGGYYIVEAKDLEEAPALAAEVPIPAGSLEVRPVMPG